MIIDKLYYICYIYCMTEPLFKIRETRYFKRWIRQLKDRHARIRIGMRIERLQDGNPGNHKDFGDISELKIDYGPGYRVYYLRHKNEIIVLLVGGDKSTQKKDIATAKDMARSLREGKDDDRF